MIDKSDLFLIYKANISLAAPFELVNFMATNGPIPLDYLQKLSMGHEDLCFEKLEELHSFALRVAAEMEASAVYVLSTEDYNLALDQAYDKKSYRTIFEKAGERLEADPQAHRSGDRPLLGKLFGAFQSKK